MNRVRPGLTPGDTLGISVGGANGTNGGGDFGITSYTEVRTPGRGGTQAAGGAAATGSPGATAGPQYQNGTPQDGKPQGNPLPVTE